MLSVRVSIIGRYIFLACVTLRHKTTNYLRISSNTPSKGLTCHQTSSFRTQLAAWCTESAEYCDKSPRCDQISHHTSHITCHTQHTTQSIQMRGGAAPRQSIRLSNIHLPVYMGKILKCLQIFLSYFNSAKIFKSTDNFCRCTTRPRSIITIMTNKCKYFTKHILKKRTKNFH